MRVVLARLMDTQIGPLPIPAGWVVGGLNKVPVASAGTLVLGRAIPSALALKPENSIPPHMSLVHFEQLSFLWSLG